MREVVHLVSPRYTHRKLEPPFYRDIVDVLEDRIRGWLLAPALELLKTNDFSIASVALTTNYFEGIEIYCSGQDSKNSSRKFFQRGFQRVFRVRNQPEAIQDAISDRLYDMLRCGFAHDAMFRSGIYFSTIRSEPFLVTYRKKDGAFDMTAALPSVFINPALFVRGVEQHFTSYVSKLRSGKDKVLRTNFELAVAMKWHLNGGDRYVGMTEDQFLSGSAP